MCFPKNEKLLYDIDTFPPTFGFFPKLTKNCQQTLFNKVPKTLIKRIIKQNSRNCENLSQKRIFPQKV